MKDETLVKKMAELLKSGATMLDKTCPVCNTPLFRLKNDDVVCPKCNSRVYIVSSEEEESRVFSSLAISNLEKTIATKINDLDNRLQRTSDLDELKLLTMILLGLLDALDKIRKLTK
ncbi:MAG: hypothetical protein B6U95_00740 [Thermofilum sp. ex4484_82]|nr:hypothetical protein [Thermoproteales archaeon]OYT30328.1 MAG: hypothetical protein B6U95_00740 [Thermofilum sp. ex4484_82]OYT39933.1 MAG: hypothetical protein B6U96_00750 [Archaeoglobales archaeon ex4484_92]RLE73728.1 MAG: hypothetical protein DRZ80_05795 [Thermoprotei archaeon]RLE84086.1 MAG: hypothetical protein DRJ39_03735 [Thermoprotei archaeon]